MTAERANAPRIDSAGRRVLLVEDDDVFRQSVARNLEMRGHQVLQASSVDGARGVLATAAPDVVILDINLPDASGWDVLRDCSLGPDTAVIMLTGTPMSPKRLAELHPFAYLPKPFPLEALLRLVERAGRPIGEHDDPEL